VQKSADSAPSPLRNLLQAVSPAPVPSSTVVLAGTGQWVHLLLYPRASAAVVAWEEAQNHLEQETGRSPVPVSGSPVRKCVYAAAGGGSFLGLVQYRGYLLCVAAPDTVTLLPLLRRAGRAWSGKG
jgi:hypothetical protein